MPPLPSVPQVLKIVLHYKVGIDVNAATVLHWVYAGLPPTSAQINTFCVAFNALTAAEWPIYLDNQTSYEGINVIDLSSPTAGAGFAGTLVAGARVGAFLGASSCVLVSYPVGRRYRGGKPRTYLPWGTGADLVDRNLWDPVSVGLFHTGWSTILGAVPAAGPIGAAALVSQCVVSYYGPPNRFITGSTGRIRTVSTVRGAALVDLISTFTVSPKVGSQRRRNLQRA